MFAVHGILFNHEGTKRGEEFVTRKISKGVARIKHHLDNATSIESFEPIKLGNIYSKRDWSDSEDFVKGVWLMLNQDKPKDYLLASGETHTIKEFIQKAFREANISGCWVEIEGQPLRTRFVLNADEYRLLVEIDEKFYRPAEVEILQGDPEEAMKELGWKPEISFDELVGRMVQWDIEKLRAI